MVIDTADSDDDGVPDVIDNCDYTYNPEQLDSDSDGLGDICDDCTDTDGDGFGDPGFVGNTCSEDNCPDTSNPDQVDTDGDGLGDACDECTDTDGDGFGDDGFVANTCPEDNCPTNHNPNQSDSNGDGVGDACSLNEDYHGVYTIMNTATKEVWSQNVVWSFAGGSFAMWLDTASELTHCFCAISGRYEATDRILLSVDAYQPDEDAGCTSCNDNENPDGLFDYAWLSNTLTLSQTTGGWERTLSLVSGCCQLRADIGHDGIVDISDLVWLVDYMFNGGAPPICMAEADVTGSGSELIDISDLVYLIDYMFSDGPPPVPCP